MIDIRGGELINLITQPFDDTDMRCFSYALKICAEFILDRADIIRTNAFIDGMPEYILDILAQEMRAPYYSADMDSEMKRDIVKNSLVWQYKAGTKSAVEELLASAFGDGNIIEWQDGGTPPGTFDAVIDLNITEEGVRKFLDVIRMVKNERSHLNQLLTLRKHKVPIPAAAGVQSYIYNKIRCKRGDIDGRV